MRVVEMKAAEKVGSEARSSQDVPPWLDVLRVFRYLDAADQSVYAAMEIGVRCLGEKHQAVDDLLNVTCAGLFADLDILPIVVDALNDLAEHLPEISDDRRQVVGAASVVAGGMRRLRRVVARWKEMQGV